MLLASSSSSHTDVELVLYVMLVSDAPVNLITAVRSIDV